MTVVGPIAPILWGDLGFLALMDELAARSRKRLPGDAHDQPGRLPG